MAQRAKGLKRGPREQKARTRLAAIRLERGVTQAELAEVVGIPEATLANIEQKRNVPAVQVLRNLAIALEVDFDEVLEPEWGAEWSALSSDAAEPPERGWWKKAPSRRKEQAAPIAGETHSPLEPRNAAEREERNEIVRERRRKRDRAAGRQPQR